MHNRTATAILRRIGIVFAALLGLACVARHDQSPSSVGQSSIGVGQSSVDVGQSSIAVVGAFGAAQDWDFVQSVGGMAVDDPIRQGGNWLLPVRVDVSGTTTITVKPTTMNSGIVCKFIAADTQDRAIYLTVWTRVATGAKETRDSTCAPVPLGHPAAGTYSLFYKDPRGQAVHLRDIIIGKESP